MSITVEVCNDGTITRASARVLNRKLGTAFSGTTSVFEADDACAAAGVLARLVNAAALKGADKGRHTREVNRALDAQVRRAARKSALVVAVQATA